MVVVAQKVAWAVVRVVGKKVVRLVAVVVEALMAGGETAAANSAVTLVTANEEAGAMEVALRELAMRVVVIPAGE